MKTLSIVIPAYNEEAFIETLLKRIQSVRIDDLGFQMELVVVDDGSKDATAEMVKLFPNVKLIQQKNQGKGKAVQTGIASATGDYILVQDADLEYAPEDYRAMLPLLDGEKVSVYGSRILGQFRAGHRFPLPGKHPEQGFGPYLANVVLSLWCFLLYGRWITDLLTAYKIYPTSAIRKMTVVTKGFETDHEITAKLIHQGLRIREVPIDYVPRSVEEGKKIKMTDGFIAVWTLFRFRWSS